MATTSERRWTYVDHDGGSLVEILGSLLKEDELGVVEDFPGVEAKHNAEEKNTSIEKGISIEKGNDIHNG